ncbi:hypothetical protein ASF43_13685 [Pseudorhodoferax sp. Leaf267]|nr:hypothetical protein ASF43_13685 [Pseudorhodoferax sp. Leaf267]
MAGMAHGQARPSATVLFASEGGSIIGAGGERRPVQQGMTLTSGDTIDTGGATVQLRMVDGAMIALRPQTTLRLDAYHVAGEGVEERGYMRLIKGGLRTVSGFIGKANPDNYRMETPVGLIGIRGTEYTAVLRDGLTVNVTSGRIALCNDSGCNDVARGMSAFAASRTSQPTISRLVSTAVPAGSGQSGTATTAGVANAPVADASVPPARLAANEVQGYLQALAAPASEEAGPAAPAPADGGGVLTAPPPGRFTPPPGMAAPVPVVEPEPAVPAPAPAPAPAPGPGGTAPAPTPAPGGAAPAPLPVPPPRPGTPPSAPFVESPLPSSAGTVMAVSSDRDGSTQVVSATGQRTFDGTALTEVRERAGSGKKLLKDGAAVQTHSDGRIAWGRWTDGKHDVKGSEDDDDEGGKGRARALHYFTFAGTPSLPVLKNFQSFASTATTITSRQGQVLVTGAENAASGSLRVTFPGPIGGFATFNLTVPVPDQTYTLTGTAAQTGSFGFAGGALITSTGAGCAATCTGALGNGVAVRGMVGDTGSARAGLLYGFRNNLGVVSGAIVFKP